MKRLLFVLSVFLFPALVSAAVPEWAKTGRSSSYPQEMFFTAAASGSSYENAEYLAKKDLFSRIIAETKKQGDKGQESAMDMLLMPFCEVRLKHSERGKYYVLAAIDKSSFKISIEEELSYIERMLFDANLILDTSRNTGSSRIREIDGVLELYERRDAIYSLKKLLKESVAVSDITAYEREKLVQQRKELLKKASYYIEAEGALKTKIRDLFAKNGFVVVNANPAREEDGETFLTVKCSIQSLKTMVNGGIKYDWIADTVLYDSFSNDTVIYSSTAAGETASLEENDAKEKARTASEKEILSEIENFLKEAL